MALRGDAARFRAYGPSNARRRRSRQPPNREPRRCNGWLSRSGEVVLQVAPLLVVCLPNHRWVTTAWIRLHHDWCSAPTGATKKGMLTTTPIHRWTVGHSCIQSRVHMRQLRRQLPDSTVFRHTVAGPMSCQTALHGRTRLSLAAEANSAAATARPASASDVPNQSLPQLVAAIGGMTNTLDWRHVHLCFTVAGWSVISLLRVCVPIRVALSPVGRSAPAQAARWRPRCLGDRGRLLGRSQTVAAPAIEPPCSVRARLCDVRPGPRGVD